MGNTFDHIICLYFAYLCVLCGSIMDTLNCAGYVEVRGGVEMPVYRIAKATGERLL